MLEAKTFSGLEVSRHPCKSGERTSLKQKNKIKKKKKTCKKIHPSRMPYFSPQEKLLTLQKVPFLSTPTNKELLEMWVQRMRIK